MAVSGVQPPNTFCGKRLTMNAVFLIDLFSIHKKYIFLKSFNYYCFMYSIHEIFSYRTEKMLFVGNRITRNEF